MDSVKSELCYKGQFAKELQKITIPWTLYKSFVKFHGKKSLGART